MVCCNGNIDLFHPVESIELLLQIIVEESGSAFTPGLEEDTTAWVSDYVHTHTHTLTEKHK